MSMETLLLYALTSADGSKVYAEAENINALHTAAHTLRDDGEDVDSMIVQKAGQYDGATTALIQEMIL